MQSQPALDEVVPERSGIYLRDAGRARAIAFHPELVDDGDPYVPGRLLITATLVVGIVTVTLGAALTALAAAP